jgi:hypothetical protein
MLDNRNSGRNGAAQPISGRKPADASHIRPHFPGENGGARILAANEWRCYNLPGELRARKSKLIQGKILAFAWIPLAESGLFKGLWRKKQKNLVRAQLAPQVVRWRPQRPFQRRPAGQRPSPVGGSSIAQISDFANTA